MRTFRGIFAGHRAGQPQGGVGAKQATFARWIAALAVIGGSALAFADVTVAAQSPCPQGTSPYSLSAASIKACGLQVVQRHAVVPLSGGGTRSEYVLPNSQVLSFTTPPASFDASKASAAELKQFGVPTEPATNSPEYTKWRAMIDKGITGVAPPSQLIISTPAATQSPGGSQSSSSVARVTHSGTQTQTSKTATSSESAAGTTTWSGYFDWNGKGSFTHTAAYFTEPGDNNSTPCKAPRNQGSIWGGIGGWETGSKGPLGQDGTVQHQEGYGEDEAFFEVLPAVEARTGFKSTPGAYFLADTQWTGSKYTFYFYNYANGKSTHAELGGTFNGKTADYIAERQKGTNLYNFATIHFQGFTNGKAFHEPKYKTERLTMSNANEVNATPGPVVKNYEFADTWKACAGEPAANEEERSGSGEGAEPIATTGGTSSVGEHEATAAGTVNPEGAITGYQFEYGTEAENYSQASAYTKLSSGFAADPVSAVLTGLQPGVTYHYRVIANSENGVSAGEDKSFTTTGSPPPPPPTVSTGAAGGIGLHKATLEATVNPHGTDTHYYFEYGPNPGLYEQTAPIPPGTDAGSGTTAATVKTALTKLAPYTTYYYRVVASSSSGTSYGEEMQFTTLSAWAIQTTPLVGYGGTLESVTCASASACTAVGNYVPETGPLAAPLAETWNGSSWTSQSIPNLTGAKVSALQAVACSATKACAAAGYYKKTQGGSAIALAEVWESETWKAIAVPVPTGAKWSQLERVACPAAKACTAVGFYESSTKEDLALIERWNGSSWTRETAPIPHEASEGVYRYEDLDGISCISASNCTAAGSYASSKNGTDAAFVDRWNGTNWTAETIPGLGERNWSYLSAIVCASTTSCTATGGYEEALVKTAVVARWNGTTWTYEVVPAPLGGENLSFHDISCPSGVCTVVGSYSGSKLQSIAEWWNGTTWEVQPFLPPSGSSEMTLHDLACVSSYVCTAVGSSVVYPGPETFTLAERSNFALE